MFEDIKVQKDDSTPIGISSEETLKDDVNFKTIAQDDRELEDGLPDSSKCGHLETDSELTKLQKSFEVSLPQRAEETDDILESDKGLDPIEKPPAIPNVEMSDIVMVTSHSTLSSIVNRVFQPESNEQVEQNEEHEFKQVIGDLRSATDLEGCDLDVSQGTLHPMVGGSEKLSVTLQRLKSQLTILR